MTGKVIGDFAFIAIKICNAKNINRFIKGKYR